MCPVPSTAPFPLASAHTLAVSNSLPRHPPDTTASPPSLQLRVHLSSATRGFQSRLDQRPRSPFPSPAAQFAAYSLARHGGAGSGWGQQLQRPSRLHQHPKAGLPASGPVLPSGATEASEGAMQHVQGRQAAGGGAASGAAVGQPADSAPELALQCAARSSRDGSQGSGGSRGEWRAASRSMHWLARLAGSVASRPPPIPKLPSLSVLHLADC